MIFTLFLRLILDPVNRKIVKYVHIHIQAYTSLKKSLTVSCILSNGEVIKYHKFISVVVIELSVRCLNTGPEDRLLLALSRDICKRHTMHHSK